MNQITPLELLNMHITDGKSSGPMESKLYQKFNQDLTWDSMLNKGYQSDLAPLLYHIITKTDTLKPINQSTNKPFNQIDDSVISKLKHLYHQNMIRSMVMFSELDKILNTFEKEGIDIIQLKGAELGK